MAEIIEESEVSFKKLIKRTGALEGVGRFASRPELEELRVIMLRTLRRLQDIQDQNS